MIFSRAKQTGATDPLNAPLLHFSERDVWTLRDACEGTQIFGATGSGKTSGSGQAIAKSFLHSGFGGLVLTAKPDDRATWEKYAREAGREDSLLVFSPENALRFNFMDYEHRRPGRGAGQTENLVRLFYTVLEVAAGKEQKTNDSFWEHALKQMLRNAIDLVTIAKGRLTLSDLYEVIKSAPQGHEQLDSVAWQESSFCFQCVVEGDARIESGDLPEIRRHDFELAATYWLGEFPGIAERTRSIIVASFTSMADSFLRGSLRELFCTKTNVTPEFTELGHILILDLPVKEYGEVGRFAQVLFKYIWQQAIERRDIAKNDRPVFLWADEAQFFVSTTDSDFQTTARSSRACTVYLTQNLPNYYATVGDEHRVDALLGNLNTKIFHRNSDQKTNNWAAELFAKSWQSQHSFSTNQGQDQQGSHGSSHSKALEYEVLQQEFSRLRVGGPASDYLVDSIIYQGGRIFEATGSNAIRPIFPQR